MGILAWILFGLIAGAIAQILLPGEDPGGGGFMGVLITIVIGIVGAFVGGIIGALLGFGGVTEFDLRSMAIAVVGAIVLLLVWRLIARQTVEHA
ncbi:MAG: GlsB/YeaQ/YmgE family stress response membrane protein [Dehalococcoidia bacterium]|nr:GlsB/YeaQ/YmgE family stress response membrane protein [Dehalococcoidia bacterium]